MPAKGTTRKNFEKKMIQYAQFLFFAELKDLESLRELGYSKATDDAFRKVVKVSKNTLTNWRKPDSPFWEIFRKEDLGRWKRCRPVAMQNLLKDDPKGFLKMTWGEEAKIAFSERTESADLTGKKPENMTNDQLNERLKQVEDAIERGES